MRKLSRIKQIQALEASARHGSFVGAATELGISPAAVGQLVRSLESWLGYPLFKRMRGGHKRLDPVEETRMALEVLSEGFDKLETGLDKLKSRKSRRTITVTVSQAFAANWLIMRLNDFIERPLQTDVRLDVSDRLTDLAHLEADIGIRFGLGTWPGLKASLLMNDEVIAVCSPAILPADGKATPAWLGQAPLIHNVRHYADNDIPTWDEWMKNFRLGHGAKGIRLQINSTATVIQAALAGRGVALTRHALVTQHIALGKLHHVLPQYRFPIRHAYYVVASQQSLQRTEVAAFRDWLLEQAASKDCLSVPPPIS